MIASHDHFEAHQSDLIATRTREGFRQAIRR